MIILWLCRYFSDVCLHLLCMCSPPAFQVCTAADDKTAAVEDFLRYLYGAMASDAIWQYASEEQLQDAQMAIERSVMNRIFKLAFYPNQDGDILRDQWVTAAVPHQRCCLGWISDCSKVLFVSFYLLNKDELIIIANEIHTLTTN